MRKLINFYGNNIELDLEAISYKKVAKYIRQKLDDADFYIQKKRDGSYRFYCLRKNSNTTSLTYYSCVFIVDEPQ